MITLKTGIRQPPGLRATPRTWNTKPTRPSATVASETSGSTVRAARRLQAPQTPAISRAGLRTSGLYITRWL